MLEDLHDDRRGADFSCQLGNISGSNTLICMWRGRRSAKVPPRGPLPGDARCAIPLRRRDGFWVLSFGSAVSARLSTLPRGGRQIAAVARSIVSPTWALSRVRGSLCFSLYGSVPPSLSLFVSRGLPTVRLGECSGTR